MTDVETLDGPALMERAAEGDERAWREVVDRYGRLLTRFARQRGASPEQAKDLAQKTWVRAFRHAHRYDASKASLSTWLCVILKRLALNDRRDRNRYPQIPFASFRHPDPGDRPLQWPDETLRPDRLHERRELRERVEAAVLALPPHLAAPLVLREWEGKLYREAAAVCGLSINSFKSRLHRARQAFLAELEAQP